MLNWLFSGRRVAAPFLGEALVISSTMPGENPDMHQPLPWKPTPVDLLDKELATKPYILGDDYTIADVPSVVLAVWPRLRSGTVTRITKY